MRTGRHRRSSSSRSRTGRNARRRESRVLQEASSRRSGPARSPPRPPTAARTPVRARPLERRRRDVLELGRDRGARSRPARPARARRCTRLGDAGRPPGPAGLSGSGSRTTTPYPMTRARRVNIRPSWPPPSMPTVAPGRITRAPGAVSSSTRSVWAARKASSRRGERRRPRAPGSPRRRAPRCARRPRRWRTSRPARPPASARSRAASRAPGGAREVTGTPSTGSGVLAASMPGRWAAPPAPAMMHRRPRPRASSA